MYIQDSGDEVSILDMLRWSGWVGGGGGGGGGAAANIRTVNWVVFNFQSELCLLLYPVFVNLYIELILAGHPQQGNPDTLHNHWDWESLQPWADPEVKGILHPPPFSLLLPSPSSPP